MPSPKKMPGRAQIERYLNSLAETIEADADGTRDVLRQAFQQIRVVPLEENLRLEMILSEVRAGDHCGGPIGTVQHTGPLFVADIGRTRGTPKTKGFVRVLPPRLAG